VRQFRGVSLQAVDGWDRDLYCAIRLGAASVLGYEKKSKVCQQQLSYQRGMSRVIIVTVLEIGTGLLLLVRGTLVP
jgi:hypothetical protein